MSAVLRHAPAQARSPNCHPQPVGQPLAERGGVLERLLGEDVVEDSAPGCHRHRVANNVPPVATSSAKAPDTTRDSSGGVISEAISSRIP